MKIAVTGGAGFIGSHCCEHFTKQGHDVVAVDNFSRHLLLGKSHATTEYNAEFLSSIGVPLVNADIRNAAEITKALAGCDAVIHTAAQTAVTTSLDDPLTDFQVNAMGTIHVLEAARKNDAAVVFCSTNKVYGANVNALSLAEDGMRYKFSIDEGVHEGLSIDHTEHTPYGSSKLLGDIYCQDYAHVYGLKTGVFRMSCIYGTRQFGVEDQGWVAWFAIAAIFGLPLTIYGDGKQVRDVLYVKDLVNLYDKFLQSSMKHGVFNTGGGPQNTLSLLELLDILEDITGKRSAIKYSDWRPSDQKVFISDISKVSRQLSWKPTVPPREGVGMLTEWILRNRSVFAKNFEEQPTNYSETTKDFPPKL